MAQCIVDGKHGYGIHIVQRHAAILWIDDEHERRSGAQVDIDFSRDVAKVVTGREDFDGYVGSERGRLHIRMRQSP